jgi:nucleotide-binding universal stress UspA family protein
MYSRILVPLDRSQLAAGVFPYARWLASALTTSVELLHVNDPARLARTAQPLDDDGYLESIAATFAGLSVKRTTVTGDPAEMIVRQASAVPGTLITMATHGYSGAIRWLLGSVAEKVFHAATVDLLLVRAAGAPETGTAELKTVIVPLDLSDAAEKVLPTVAALADRLTLEVLLVHVTRHIYSGPPDALPVFGAIPNLKELWEQDKALGDKYLSEKRDQLRAQGMTRLSTRVLEGGIDGAAGDIVDLAQNTPGSLIALTRHGQSGFGPWLVGSITRRVVQHSRRPVLIVRPQSAARLDSA